MSEPTESASSWFPAWLGRFAAGSAVYDVIARIVGVSRVHEHVAPYLRFEPGTRVLDVGGGTGTLKRLLAPGVRHFCLDLEWPKLERYVRKFHDARPIQGDGTAIPMQAGAVDAVTLALVTHHLTDVQLTGVLSEIGRVLSDDGVLVLYDAVWAPSRFGGRLLWKVDRGSYPRRADQLAAAVRQRFDVIDQKQFAVIHRYVAFICKPRRPVTA